MTGADLAFAVAAVATLAGAVGVVAARGTPVTNAIAGAVSMTGVAALCALVGAPLVGGLLLAAACAVAATIALFSLEWVGTGRAGVPPPSPGRVALRVLGAALAIGAAAAVFEGARRGAPFRTAALDPQAPPVVEGAALGARLFAGDPVAVAVVGGLLLVALLAGTTLARRSPS